MWQHVKPIFCMWQHCLRENCLTVRTSLLHFPSHALISLSLSLFLSSFPLSFSLSFSLAFYFSHTHTLSLTIFFLVHTHTHTYSLSLSLIHSTFLLVTLARWCLTNSIIMTSFFLNQVVVSQEAGSRHTTQPLTSQKF
jgi:hypothetical protein